MCNYCARRMYLEAPLDEQLAWRLRRFIEELRRDPCAHYTRGSVAGAIEEMLECDATSRAVFEDFQHDVAEYEEAVMHEQLERDAR